METCLKLDVGTIIIGVNQGWKQESNIGKRNNQNFVQIPHYSLREKIKSLCETYGIQYIEQEESYTSKASALDLDEIPVYNPDTSVYIFLTIVVLIWVKNLVFFISAKVSNHNKVVK